MPKRPPEAPLGSNAPAYRQMEFNRPSKCTSGFENWIEEEKLTGGASCETWDKRKMREASATLKRHIWQPIESRMPIVTLPEGYAIQFLPPRNYLNPIRFNIVGVGVDGYTNCMEVRLCVSDIYHMYWMIYPASRKLEEVHISGDSTLELLYWIKKILKVIEGGHNYKARKARLKKKALESGYLRKRNRGVKLQTSAN